MIQALLPLLLLAGAPAPVETITLVCGEGNRSDNPQLSSVVYKFTYVISESGVQETMTTNGGMERTDYYLSPEFTEAYVSAKRHRIGDYGFFDFLLVRLETNEVVAETRKRIPSVTPLKGRQCVRVEVD